MAVVGTLTTVEDTPGLKSWTWVVSADAIAGNVSDPLDTRGLDIIEWYSSVTTGIAAGTSHNVGLCLESDGDGTLQIDPGRLIRSSGTNNAKNAGYCILPPPSLRLVLISLGTSVTAYTVVIVGRASASRAVYPR